MKYLVTIICSILMMVMGLAVMADTPITTTTRTSFATGQVTVNSSIDLIVAARGSRTSVTICNSGSAVLYIGTSTVATDTGLAIPVSSCFTLDRSSGAVYGVCASSTTASYLEVF